MDGHVKVSSIRVILYEKADLQIFRKIKVIVVNVLFKVDTTGIDAGLIFLLKVVI